MHQILAARWIQVGIMALLAIMPFHAFLTTWLGATFGYRALWQSWKEIVIASMALAWLWLVWRHPERFSHIAKQHWFQAVVAFGVCGLVASLLALSKHDLALTPFLYGLKTDTEFLVVAALAYSVATSSFIHRAVKLTLGAGIIVSLFVLLQAYILPPDWLASFGYNQDTIPPYLKLTATSDTLRFAGTLGGPNQLGTYLVIIIALTLTSLVQFPILAIGLILNLCALWQSYSRSAWLGALATMPLLWLHIPHRHRRLALLGGGVGVLLVAAVTIMQLNKYPALQESILHSTATHHSNPASSDSLRLVSIKEGLKAVMSSPLGHGFGSAGPATFQNSQPFIIENQFLQLAYETGWIGLASFLLVIAWLVKEAWHSRSWQTGRAMALAVTAIALAGLTLPTFTDSTTAIIAFALLGLTAGDKRVETKSL